MSDLVRGGIESFSLDALVENLTRVEMVVTVRTKAAAKVA